MTGEFLTSLQFAPLGGGLYVITAPLVFRRPNGELIEVQPGFVTDFATCWFRGLHDAAAVIHDWLYVERKIGGRKIRRWEADRVLWEAMEALDCLPAMSGVMYTGVILLGWWWWYRRPVRQKILRALHLPHPTTR